MRGYWKFKAEALDRAVWRTYFRRGYEPVAKQTTEWSNKHQWKFVQDPSDCLWLGSISCALCVRNYVTIVFKVYTTTICYDEACTFMAAPCYQPSMFWCLTRHYRISSDCFSNTFPYQCALFRQQKQICVLILYYTKIMNENTKPKYRSTCELRFTGDL
jgi:hypothetical protein